MIPAKLPIQNLKKYSSESLVKVDGGYKLSVYNDSLTNECIALSLLKLKKAFPSLPPGFFDLLVDRIRELGFTDQRLIDSINNVIDTCVYPTPTIANFISYDKNVKLLTYEDMLKLVAEYGSSIWDRYTKITVDDKVFWHQ